MLRSEMLSRFSHLPDRDLETANVYARLRALDLIGPMHTDALREFAVRVIGGRDDRKAILGSVSELTRMVESPSVEEYLERVVKFRVLMREIIVA